MSGESSNQPGRRSRQLIRAVATGAAITLACTALVSAHWSPTVASASEPSDVVRASADDADRIALFYGQSLSWSACGGRDECAFVTVPLSYLDPAGATLKVALRRLPASSTPSRGSILVDPGGPGGSGTALIDTAAEALIPEAVRAQFDIVGIDPRGVGQSTRVLCLTPAQVRRMNFPLPIGRAEERAALSAIASVARGCATRGMPIASEVGTANAARDLDIVRAALGEPRLNYLGISYGTYLGAVYAQEFPARVGLMLLDAGLSPSVDMVGWARAQVTGFERAIRRWSASCPARPSCPWAGSAKDIRMHLRGLLDDLRREPLRAPGTKSIGDGDIRSILQAFLAGGTASWPTIDAVLAAAAAGDGRLIDTVSEAVKRGLGTSPANMLSANASVNCYDRPTESSGETVRARAREWERTSPVFGRALAFSTYTCATWPVRRGGQIATISSSTEQPILLIGGTRDPLTPLRWTSELAASFKHPAVVTFTGEGHGALGKGSACITWVVTQYFLQGLMPGAGTRCR